MGKLIDIFKDSILIESLWEIDNSTLLKEIKAMQARGEGDFNKGYWRSNTMDGSTAGALGDLEKRVKIAVQEYINATGIGLTPQIEEFWVQDYKEGAYMAPHIHPVAICSAVYYPYANENSAKIYFDRPGKEALAYANAAFRPYSSVHTMQRCDLKPNSGMLVVFPGWFSHSVDVVKPGEERTVVAFNYSSSDRGAEQSWDKYKVVNKNS